MHGKFHYILREWYLTIDPAKLANQVSEYSRGITKASSDYFGWMNESVSPKKSHWALLLDTSPYMSYPVRSGLIFTYEGVKIDVSSRIVHKDGIMENAYVAGEIASGNVLSKGYLAGFDLTIGTVLGRLAGGWKGA